MQILATETETLEDPQKLESNNLKQDSLISSSAMPQVIFTTQERITRNNEHTNSFETTYDVFYKNITVSRSPIYKE